MWKLILLVAHSRGKEKFLRYKYRQLFPSTRYKAEILTTLLFCWAKVSPSQHLFLVKLQIYILFLGMFWNFYNWNFYNWSICRWLLLGVTSHYTAIFHFPWYNREQYDIQHHNLIEDLLQKQSNIRALRKSYFETFWKLTEALLRWKTF